MDAPGRAGGVSRATGWLAPRDLVRRSRRFSFCIFVKMTLPE